MRAVVIERFGDPSGMVVRELPDPTPAAGQVVVRPEAIGVGGVDAVIRRGTLSGYGFAEGLIPGSEVAGVITAVGDGVDPSWLGRRVWAFTGTSGGYAELAIARVEDITILPDELSSINAVTLGSAAVVAHFALAHVHFTAGESVLVRGAAGSIGIATVELASRGGASVVAVTTSSPERGQRLRELGATLVLDRGGRAGQAGNAEQARRAGQTGHDGTEQARQAGHDDDRDSQDHPASATFDVIVDIVGGDAVPTFLDRLAPNGRMIVVGAVAGLPPADFGMHLIRSFQQSRSFATFSLDTVPLDERDAVRAAQFDDAVKGLLHPVVHDVLPLDQAPAAHRQMDDGAVFGRIVLTP